MSAARTISDVRFAAVAIALVLARPALSDTLHDHDNGPLTGYFGIPDSTEGSVILKPGVDQWSSLLMTANHSISDDRNVESIILDGETTRVEFAYRRGIAPGIELGVELPYVWHESGGFDSLINNWHGWLGFPGGFRDTRSKGQLEYQYTDGAATRVDYRTNGNGIGDARLFAGWRFHESRTHTMAVRFGVKIPTGDSESLLGSGGTDISIGLAGDLRGLFGVSGLKAYYRASVISIGTPDLLADRYKDYVSHIGIGAGYTISERIDLLVQAAVRSPLYDSGIEHLGDSAGTLTFGGNFRFFSNYVIGVGVSEDIKVQSAPDVAFQLSIKYQPK